MKFDNVIQFSIVVLAGGKSERMGTLKQLLPWGGATMLQHVINNAIKANPIEIIVVLGYKAQEIARTIKQKKVKIVINPDFERGMSSSLKCAVSIVSSQSRAIMFILGDQPLVSIETIKLLLYKHCCSELGITVPVYGGVRGRPVILDKKYKDELLNLTGDVGARQVIDNHPDDVLEVEVRSDEVLVDIDTIEDYERNLDQSIQNR
jgi:molybdenum cofactor cytidylyltransferase